MNNSRYFYSFVLVIWMAMMISGGSIPDHAKADQPNILLIMADDMGYSDIGSYGATVIETPHLDRLAQRGQRFTQMYNVARCSPTRASLMTGLYPHQAGMGWLAGTGFKDPPPGYLGHLNRKNVTVAEVLGNAGYKTMAVGKWHLGNTSENAAPWQRGFDRYFGRLVSRDYWSTDNLWLDGKSYNWEANHEKRFYLTDAQGTFALRFLKQHLDQGDGNPFFMYLPFYAPHWYLHAPQEDINRYRDKFSMGWDSLRRMRYEKMVDMGIISADHKLAPRDPAVPAWKSVPEEKREEWTLKMAVYAAMVDRMDQNIGRVIEYLKQQGEFKNTLIMFLSDNGACAEDIGPPESPDNPPGPPGSKHEYMMPWANVSSTPFRFYKHFAHEGGIATPFIAHWPGGMAEEQKGSITREPAHVIDIMATLVDLTEASYPKTFEGRNVTRMKGKSLLPVFNSGSREGHDMIFWEHEGKRAVRNGRWKLVSTHHDDEIFYEAWNFPRTGFTSEWELYDMEEDRTELTDLSAKHPERVRNMASAWENWAERVNVTDWDEMQCISRRNMFQRVCGSEGPEDN